MTMISLAYLLFISSMTLTHCFHNSWRQFYPSHDRRGFGLSTNKSRGRFVWLIRIQRLDNIYLPL